MGRITVNMNYHKQIKVEHHMHVISLYKVHATNDPVPVDNSRGQRAGRQ